MGDVLLIELVLYQILAKSGFKTLVLAQGSTTRIKSGLMNIFGRARIKKLITFCLAFKKDTGS